MRVENYKGFIVDIVAGLYIIIVGVRSNKLYNFVINLLYFVYESIRRLNDLFVLVDLY